MKRILQIAVGVILAVVVIVAVIAAGHASHQQSNLEQQDAEFCKKLQQQGADAKTLAAAGCKQSGH